MNPLPRRTTSRLENNEAPRRFDRTERIEIVMSAARKANELFDLRASANRRSPNTIEMARSLVPCITNSGTVTRGMRSSE